MKNPLLISLALILAVAAIFVNFILSIHGSDLLMPFSIATATLEIGICLMVSFFIKKEKLSQIIIIVLILISSFSQLGLLHFTLWIGRQVESRNHSSLTAKILEARLKYNSQQILTGFEIDLAVQAVYPSDYSIYVDASVSPADRSVAYQAFREMNPDGVLTTSGQYNRFSIYQVNGEKTLNGSHLRVSLKSKEKVLYTLNMMPLYISSFYSDKECINKFKTKIEQQFYDFLKTYDQQLSILIKISVGSSRKDRMHMRFDQGFSRKTLFQNMEKLFKPC